jgi:predicted DNA-binding protein with PD1-like motif
MKRGQNIKNILETLERDAALSSDARLNAIETLDAIDWTGFTKQEEQAYKQAFREKTAVNEVNSLALTIEFQSLFYWNMLSDLTSLSIISTLIFTCISP